LREELERPLHRDRHTVLAIDGHGVDHRIHRGPEQAPAEEVVSSGERMRVVHTAERQRRQEGRRVDMARVVGDDHEGAAPRND
jgi:hypothetical protein